MKKAIGGIIGAIVVGVVTWWLTEGLRNSTTTRPTDSVTAVAARMSELEMDIDRNGSDYKDFVAADVHACLDACVQDGGCRAITFTKSSRQCWMKSSVPLRISNSSYISAVKIDR